MILLRVFLVSLLSASVFWGSLILFGPMLISSGVRLLSDGSLRLSSVSVEPNLTVRIPRAELVNPESGVIAFSRGVIVTSGFENGHYTLNVETGPTASTENLYASSVSLKAKPIAFTDWSSVDLKLQATGLRIGSDELSADQLSASATYLPPSNFLQTSSWRLENIVQPIVGLEIQEVSLTTPPLSLDGPLPMDQLVANAIAKQITITPLRANLESLTTTLVTAGEAPRITFQGTDFAIDQYGLNVKKLTLGAGVNADLTIESPFSLRLDSVEGPNAFRGTITSRMESNDASELEVSGSIEIDNYDLSIRGLYAGDLSESTINYVAKSAADGASRTLLGSVTGTFGRDGALRSETALEVTGVNAECIPQSCEIERIVVAHNIDVGGEKLSGVSECVAEGCLLPRFSHYFKTNNTMQLMGNIQNTELFSTLALMSALAFINQMPKDGDGHILNF